MSTLRRAGRTAATVTVGLALVLSGAVAASATPGHPGTPDTAPVVFHENFENAPDTGLRTMLWKYAGTDGRHYTADEYWMNAATANGMVLSWHNTKAPSDGSGSNNGTGDNAFKKLRQLAEAIGKVNGSADPKANTVISAYTQDVGAKQPGNQVMFSTIDDIALRDSAGRFLAFSMTAAATNPAGPGAPERDNPQLMLSVSQNRVETALNTRPIDPITDGRGAKISVSAIEGAPSGPIYAGQYASDHSFLYEGGTFGIVVRNLTSAHQGNDGAFDDIKVLDVTPQLDKQFGSSTAITGDSVRLTFTVTNTAELANKKGWSFTDSLPAGLVVAGTPDVVVDGTATVQASPGATAITVTDGDLATGDDALTISLNVTSNVAGTYTNGPANITVRKGLDSPDTTTVTFEDPAPVMSDLVVRFVDEQGGKLADPQTRTGEVGAAYTTSPVEIPGYELVVVPPNAAGSFATSTTEVVYVYKPVVPDAVGTLVVHYVDELGNPLADDTTQTGNPDDPYRTTPKAIEGWTPTGIPANAEGVFVEGETVVTYVYTRTPAPAPADLVVRWVDEQGNPLADDLARTGVVGEGYTSEARAFPGYELVAEPDNASGTLAAGTTTVTYLYREIADPVVPDPVVPDPVVPDPVVPDPVVVNEVVPDPVVPEPVVVTEVLAAPQPVVAQAPLARTGSEAATLLAIGAGLVLGGSALLVTRRLRGRTS